jgi:hypothetical protein
MAGVVDSGTGASRDVQRVFCTVVTRSHLPYARALARSLAKFHDLSRLYVLVVDSVSGEDGVGGCTNIGLGELNLRCVRSFLFRYTAFELCNALKPYLMMAVRRRNPGSVSIYLDSDLCVYGSLKELWEECAGNSVILTPHTLRDYPDDGVFPGTRDLLTHGVYNAGVIAVGCHPDGDRFLDWWAERLEFGCLNEPGRGYFVDQHYLDAVPALFDGVRILKCAGYNVAHFNLHERTVERREGEWWVGDRPLELFHFTAIDWKQDCFLPGMGRGAMERSPGLRQLIGDYQRLLLEYGFGVEPQPYRYATMTSGLAIPLEARRHFVGRDRMDEGWDPFSDPEIEAWIRWYNSEMAISYLCGRSVGWVYRIAEWQVRMIRGVYRRIRRWRTGSGS